MGIDPLVAVRESARGLVKAAADEGANVAVVARAALEEALEGTQARDIQVEAREAAAAVAEGLQQGAAELGDRTVRPVRQAVSDILADMEAEGA
jgi:post-segregation antitoxin (ccd killing protein)